MSKYTSFTHKRLLIEKKCALYLLSRPFSFLFVFLFYFTFQDENVTSMAKCLLTTDRGELNQQMKMKEQRCLLATVITKSTLLNGTTHNTNSAFSHSEKAALCFSRSLFLVYARKEKSILISCCRENEYLCVLGRID